MITQERLRQLFIYKDGQLIRKKSTKGVYAGTPLGCKSKTGYVHCSIDHKMYLLHRLIFLYHHGYMPEIVDHINQNCEDNRIENLRPADKRVNATNAGMWAHNTSGVIGVSWVDRLGKWHAYITYKGKRINLGRFKSKAKAVLVRKAAEVIYGFDPKHGGSLPPQFKVRSYS